MLNSIFFLFNTSIYAQITKTVPIDIMEGLDDSTIQITVHPPFTVGSIEKIFDGNPFTNAGVQNSDSVLITLHFDSPVEINKSKIFFWHDGQWSLETANSEDDLNNQSGSYQLLVDNKDFAYFEWDSVTFSPREVKFIRLKVQNPHDNNIYMGEWVLYSFITLTSLQILPDPLMLIPGTSLQLQIEVLDNHGNSYPYDLDESIYWNSSNTAVATVDEMGKISGVSIGTSEITASTVSLSGTTTANVVSDFESSNAESMTINVALVLQDPVIDSTSMRKIHQVRGWTDPLVLVYLLLEEFNQLSDDVIRFQIVETYDDEGIFSRLDGELMTIDTLAYFYSTPARMNDLKRMTEQEGRVRFDYNTMIDYYDLDTKRNSGLIDEIWVYAHPFAGMYESILAGPNAFWWNAPPLDHPGLEKLLSIMGWNYERGVAEALHSFGHRAESAIRHVYGRWDVHAEEPNNWELFTRIDKDVPGKAHVGNIHFPPNGTSDYNYSNTNYVITYADNWKRYPVLLDQTRTVNCQEWECSHLGYMEWWYEHLPRFTGVTDGILNNWWYYIVDYEGAIEAASLSINNGSGDDIKHLVPQGFSLEQNYPNPFNPVTTIVFSLPVAADVTLTIYDILGRKVEKLVSGRIVSGEHEVVWDARNEPSGIYICQLTTDHRQKSRKMVLLK